VRPSHPRGRTSSWEEIKEGRKKGRKFGATSQRSNSQCTQHRATDNQQPTSDARREQPDEMTNPDVKQRKGERLGLRHLNGTLRCSGRPLPLQYVATPRRKEHIVLRNSPRSLHCTAVHEISGISLNSPLRARHEREIGSCLAVPHSPSPFHHGTP